MKSLHLIKKTLLLSSLLLSMYQVQAQIDTSDIVLEKQFLKKMQNKKLIHLKTGATILNTFEGGLILTQLNDKFGLIDGLGKEVCEPTYDTIQFIGDGYSIQKTGKWGFLDRKGKLVVSPKYNNIRIDKKSGIISVQKGDKWKIWNQTL